MNQSKLLVQVARKSRPLTCELNEHATPSARRHRDALCLFSITTLSLALSGVCAAQVSTENLDEVTVTGYRFLDEDTSGITNLPLPIDKIPQSISIVNNDFVGAADLKDASEIAQYTTGAMWGSYNPSDANEFWIRGFSANYAIDGLTVGYQIPEPDAAILARYEVVKGPASVVYGAQSPGGIVNLVSKSASSDVRSSVEVLGGSFGRYRVEGELAQSLNAAGTVRGIGVAAYEDQGSFVDFVKKNRAVAYIGLDFDVNPALTGYFRTSYQRTKNTPYNGIPTFEDGSFVKVPRSFFIGGSDLNNVSQTFRVDSGLSWNPSNLWSFDLKALYHHLKHRGGNQYNYSYVASDGSFPYGGERFIDWHIEDYSLAVSASRKLDDLGLDDSSVSGSIRYQHYEYDNYELTGGGPGPNPNIFAGDAAINDIFNAFTPTNTYQQDQRMNYLTASTQAVIKVSRPLTLVGGVAYSQPRIDQQLYFGSFNNFDPGNQMNYRGAVLYEPIERLDLYASYSESFQPNLRIDRNYRVLAPLSGTQYEIGAKYRPHQAILLTAAAFEIREKNIAVFDFADVNGESLYRAEDVRHRGIEVDATGRVTRRWQVRGGFSVLDPKVTNDPNHSVNNGETRPWIPRVTANLYTLYEISERLSVGGGARYVGEVKTYDNSDTSFATPDGKPLLKEIPSYAVFDAAVNYSFDLWRLQLNLKNIGDKHYAVSTPIFQSLAAGLFPGEPRSFAVSVRRDF